MRTDRKPSHERRRIYWDSGLFIELLQGTGEHLVALNQIVEAAKQGDVILVTSALTLAEVLGQRVASVKNGGPTKPISDEAADRIGAFFEHEWIAIRPCTGYIGRLAGQIARKHSLKPPDAVHAATALDAGVSVLQTRDGPKPSTSLLRKNGKIGAPPLAIELPTWAVQMRLVEAGQEEAGEEAK